MAKDISLNDPNFDPQYFEVFGATSASWASLEAGAEVSHVVVLRPLESNYFNFTSAEVTYFSNGEKVCVFVCVCPCLCVCVCVRVVSHVFPSLCHQ